MARISKKLKQRKPSIAFVVDGYTEIWYLQMLCRNEPQVRINIKPEIPSRKSTYDQYLLVKDLHHREYNKIFWIVDFDTIIKEHKEAREGVNRLKDFIRYRDELNALDNVVVIINNPCLEFWFLLHFEKGYTYYPKYSDLHIHRYLPNYRKSRYYFIKKDIYARLKPRLPFAIKNAERLQFNPKKPERSICEMNLLFNSYEMEGIFNE